jgi:IclR family KDG regulon transcriptional repressor
LTPSDDDTERGGAAARTIAILETLSRHEAIHLEQLAKEAEIPKATLLRFLVTLTAMGYIRRDEGDRYSLTLRMFSIGSRSLEHIELVNIARPIAERLSAELGETVHMGILEEDNAIYVLKVESKYMIRMHSRVGRSIPLYCTAIGKSLLADMSEDALRGYLERVKLVPFTPHTIRTKEDLREELGKIRQEGCARDREEHEEGVTCIAAPIVDYTGMVVSAISVSWPLFRFDRAEEARYFEPIQKAAREISMMLGFVGNLRG